MIPILFEKTETAFSSNGLGRLSDCIRCIVTEERNGIYECEFDYPVTGAMFPEIQEGRIIACTHDEQGDIQPFDIYGRTEPINGAVTFYAHHISYRLNEITVKPFTAGSCAEALLKIKTQSVNPNPFTFQTDKTVTADYVSDVPRNAKGMLAGEQGSILDVFGTGEYEFDKFHVVLHLHRGQDTNVSIRYGKNLIDYTNNYDTSESYTAVVPYWLGSVSDESGESEQTLVMLPEIFILSGHSVPSGREVVVPMDLSDVYEEKPSVESLRASATSRLNRSNAWLPNQTVTVDFVQLWQTDEYKDYAVLQRLRLCDTCGVFVPMYDTALRAKVIRTEYNVLLDRYDRMELGDKPTTYTAVMERMYNSKVAGVVAGLQSIAVSVDAVRAYSDGQLSSAVLAINSDIANLQDQIDGNITTWFFGVDPTMSNPPVAYDPNVEGSGWDTTEKKNNHLGDVYYNTSNGTAWRFINENGTYSWNQIADSDVSEALRLASEAKDVADAKRRVFYSQPVPPYDDGDLWTQGADGDILRCATPKAAGESYSRSDWILASKYTDNSALNAFISGTFADTVGDIEGQLDQKAETWYQSTDPSLNWGTAQLRQDHEGDLWYYTGNTTSNFSHNATYRWDGSSWQVQTIPSSVFDMIDGKSQIFVGTNTPTGAENGDLWFKGTDQPILTYVNGMWIDYNYYIDSTVSQGQADSAERNAKNYTDNAVSALQGDLEAQIDAKIETWAQTADPQTGWSDKSTHDGDLWLYTGLTPTTISGTAVKPQGVYQYAFVAGGTLCNESNVDITNENGDILEANDSGNWIAYASTSKNLFDLADGKSTIYYGSPTGTYSGVDTGDYLVDSSTGNTYRYQGGAWVKQTDYKTYTTNAIASAKTTIQNEYEQAIDDATEKIRGGTGGYVVTTTNANGQPIELLITDNLNLNQAVNVWRWNQGGLAHSSNGYNGPFSDVAITADGKINASRILTGALTANIVKAGTLTDASNKNSWNLDTGLLSILKGSINLGNGKFVATDAGKVTVKGGGLIQDASDNNSWNLDSGRLVTTSGQIGPFALTDDGLTYEDTSGSVRNYTLIDPTEIVSAQRTRVNGVYETKGVALTESVIQFLGKKNSASAKDYEKVGEISVRISSGTEERYIQYFKLENRTYMTWWGYDSSIPIQIQFTTSIEKDLFVIGTIHNSSDRRLKDHIEYLDKDADEFVRGLKPAHYIKDGEHHTGFYAQDVEDIDKWGGMVGTKGEYKTLAYNDIIAPLVAYCQHLEKRIEELERKNNK